MTYADFMERVPARLFADMQLVREGIAIHEKREAKRAQGGKKR